MKSHEKRKIAQFYINGIKLERRITLARNNNDFKEVKRLSDIALKHDKVVLNQCPVHPREAFKKAIQDNASCIIFAHNHPSGRTNPSKEDIALTRMLTSCGKILMIPVLDHIIIGRKEKQFSFAYGYPELFDEQKFNIK